MDLVWTYGEGKAPNDEDYPTKSIMTAPFTTDPAALEPRRLRSQPTVNEIEWQVGCGYAAHAGDNSKVSSILVVRLSDGMSAKPDLQVYEPIGLTCQEVFVAGTVAGRRTILRFPLAQLGPGMPPD